MTQTGRSTSLLGTVFSIEGFLMTIGIASLVYGISKDLSMNIFWGAVIIPGVVVLHFVRRKDWAKHWQELEAEQQQRLAQEERRKAAAATVKEQPHE
jgi:hypothetical protein